MSMIFSCPCGKQLRAEEEHAGRRTRCPGCGQELIIPAPSQPRAADEGLQVVAAPPSPQRRPMRSGEEPRYDQPAQTSGKAVAALIFGLLSPCLVCVGGILAIVFGIMSLGEIGRSPHRLKGRGLAICGIVLGIVGFMFNIGGGIWGLFQAVERTRDAATRIKSANNLKQIGLALQQYHADEGAFPSPGMPTRDGLPGLSWRVSLLRHLGEDYLYNQFHLDEPWDSPANRRLVDKMPSVFASPDGSGGGLTHYRLITGPGTAFPNWRSEPRIKDFPRGSTSTILVVEAADAVPWTKPDELRYDRNGPLPRFGGASARGFSAVFADGRVEFFANPADEVILRNFLTLDGR
jgi:hypothetical protein